jgi:diguanylate cyclase (GGDEF)-like protein
MRAARLRRLAIPGSISARVTFLTAIAAMMVLFVADVVTAETIRLHVLYVFPLAAVALHCESSRALYTALVLSFVFQAATWLSEGATILSASFITDICVALAASLLTLFLARTVRDNYLEIQAAGTTDPLTGLANRRKLEFVLNFEIARQRRYGSVFSLAALDLDGFKALNDAQGHRSGDEALKLLADILRQSTRSSDVLARTGGDEFAILMPNTQKVDSESLCQQLAGTISKRMADAHFPVSASIGCQTFEQAPAGAAAALHLADQAMYEAKNGGKGRAVSH